MRKTIIHLTNRQVLEVEMDRYYDLTIPVKRQKQVNAYDLPDAVYNIFRTEGFTGSVREGGSCNCEEVSLIPHGNGTHTECVGHISVQPLWLKNCLKDFFFSALLISVEPEDSGDAYKISRPVIEAALMPWAIGTQAVIVRTLPNNPGKISRRYAGKNPPYFTKNALEFLNEYGFRHLLTDLPSVDAEDDPELTAHHAFWQYPENVQRDKTITELIYVPDEAEDGYYWLNLQAIPLESDAAPSRPLIFPATMRSR